MEKRQIELSVTCFLHHKEDYLFLHRKLNKRTDPGKLNGVGGRLEPGENYVQAAIREIKEETGYEVDESKIKLTSVVKLEEGDHVDWVMCFFKAEVNSKTIPIGTETDDGRLIWIHKDKVLDSDYTLVDDIYYTFKGIVEEKDITFMTSKLNKDQKVVDAQISKLSLI